MGGLWFVKNLYSNRISSSPHLGGRQRPREALSLQWPWTYSSPPGSPPGLHPLEEPQALQ
jgi:hypothetical protein